MFITGERILERMVFASACSLRVEEVQNCVVRHLRLVREENMAGVRNQDKPRAGDVVGD